MDGSLEQVLYDLLFDHAKRAAFLAKSETTPLGPFTSIDRIELSSVARKIVKSLMYGNSASMGGLASSFPLTIQAIGRAQYEKFIYDFLSSRYFADASDIKMSGAANWCLEEAFYLFLKTKDAFFQIEREELLRFEAYKAALSILVHNPDPVFGFCEIQIHQQGTTRYALSDFSIDFVRSIFPNKALSPCESLISVVFAASSKGLALGPVTADQKRALLNSQKPS